MNFLCYYCCFFSSSFMGLAFYSYSSIFWSYSSIIFSDKTWFWYFASNLNRLYSSIDSLIASSLSFNFLSNLYWMLILYCSFSMNFTISTPYLTDLLSIMIECEFMVSSKTIHLISPFTLQIEVLHYQKTWKRTKILLLHFS